MFGPGILGNTIIASLFYNEKSTGDSYLEMLRKHNRSILNANY